MRHFLLLKSGSFVKRVRILLDHFSKEIDSENDFRSKPSYKDRNYSYPKGMGKDRNKFG